ncbi:protein VASCULATURE COMPLEXITY AND CONNECTIVITY-like [Syzygium oleosum]|uniref:protein VASCULATURE COMPLEXITY AND CONNECTIVITY-like n=1 Tax=Syzygium oleosum TaxID=219896 RepID=UPI0024BB62B1|nr:protein VASCULATURE COMPLEXITY AND CONNECTIVITY-like [Syzygium oleosum]
MANVRAFVCLLVVAMDILAGILAIEAEAAKNKAQKSSKSLACKEVRSNAFELALAATVLLALAHVTSNLLGGCICICSMDELEKSSSNRQLWFACLISSWIIAAVGFPMLVIGMLENSKLQGSCRFLHPHFLSIGGGLCFVHGVLCVILYVSSVVSFETDKVSELVARPR